MMRVALVTTFRADRKEPLVELLQRKIVENLAALVAELDRSMIPEIEAATGPSPEWDQPESRPRTRILCGMSGLAALIAHVSFWVLLPYGWFFEEIGPVGLTVFVLLWAAGYFGLSLVSYGSLLFPSFVALLDIALVFIIFKGDVRLS